MRPPIGNSAELEEYIRKVGFLPYSANAIPGFSLDELTLYEDGRQGNEAGPHPYLWRETMCPGGEAVCGRFLGRKLAFISREWIPHLANYRRNGEDFDLLYQSGKINHKAKMMMDILKNEGPKTTAELKAICGKGFESIFATLQMQLFVTAHHYQYKTDKNGNPYGWAVAYYTMAEEQFGQAYVTSKYGDEPKESLEIMIRHMQSLFPHIEMEKWGRFFA